MYKITWDSKALESLDKLEHHIIKRVLKKTDQLQEDPFHKDVKHLKGKHGFRLRVGDYRIIFNIEGEDIHILKVAF